MGHDPFDRREFLAAGGGMFLCTLAGQRVLADRGANVERLASEVKVPPKVREAELAGETTSTTTLAASSSSTREYWIRAEPVKGWNIVPTGRDAMMDQPVRGTKFTAYAYRRYQPGFTAPMGPASIPGPLIQARVGETVVVNFQNGLNTPVTMHPHGIFYSEEMDGAYKGADTDPGGFVQPGRRFRYVWDARPGTEGAWLYHDHGPMDPLPVYKGLFGTLIIRGPGQTAPDREFFVVMHSFDPSATGLRKAFSCINGRAYAGNTPTLNARVGDSVTFHVFALDNNFHTFHIHGHRWTDPSGTIVDNQTLGPGDVLDASFVEDNPGQWFYHCHVFSHLHMGMNGWYVVK